MTLYKEALAYATGEKKAPQALGDATREKKAPPVIQNWIRTREALAMSNLRDTQLTKKTGLEIDELTASDKIKEVAALGSLKDAEEDARYCSLYLFNLGNWYASRAESPSAEDLKKLQKKASDYLIYSFVLDSYQWDKRDVAKDFERSFKDFEEFQSDIFKDDAGLIHLRGILESVLMYNKHLLPEPTDDQFQKEVEKNIISRWEKKVMPTWIQ